MIKKFNGKYLVTALKGSYFNSVTVLKSVDSTSNYARNAICGSAIFAERQTEGRGRNGRSFLSDKGGLYFSLTLDAKDFPAAQYTVAAAAAVVSAIKKLVNIDTQIKWVNDIFYNGKKLCGILAERIADKIIIGIGLNFYPVDFGDLKDVATSLYSTQYALATREMLATAIIFEFQHFLRAPREEALKVYRGSSCVLGRNVSYIENGVEKYGRAAEIDDDGRLIIEDDNGRKSVNSGEISIKLN